MEATPVRPGDIIGGYRILSKLGSGGMGEVFSAIRADGLYRRRVALKLIRAHRSPAELVARINEEALLSLEAPVARVTAPDIIVPLPQGEQYYYLNANRIYGAIKRVAEF